MVYSIKSVVYHIKGVDIYLTDWQSRVSDLKNCDPHERLHGITAMSTTEFIDDLRTVTNRRLMCRMMISYALVHSDVPSAEHLIQMMVCLHQCPTITMVDDDRVITVLDSFQRLFNHNVHPKEGIPTDMAEALAAAAEWDKK